jgi:hypothetical protein
MRARYGLAPTARWKRALGWLVALLLVAGVVGLGWLISSPAVTYQLLLFRIDSPALVTMKFEVSRPADRTAVCVLRAQDFNHQDVGYATVTVPPGAGVVQPTYPLATRAEAVNAEVLGCALDQAPVRVPEPQFPPGTTNPPQQPSVAGT